MPEPRQTLNYWYSEQVTNEMFFLAGRFWQNVGVGLKVAQLAIRYLDDTAIAWFVAGFGLGKA